MLLRISKRPRRPKALTFLLLILVVLLVSRAPSSSAAKASMADRAAGAAGETCAADAAGNGNANDDEERYAGLDNPSVVVPADAPLLRVLVLSLRPTQLAVGKYSVGLKAAKVAKKRDKGGATALDDWLKRHPIPCVRGPPELAPEAPDDQQQHAPLFLIDHHHLAAALHGLGIDECYAAVVRDYSSSEAGASFWARMREDGCLWPRDAGGREVPWEDLPSRLPPSVAGLEDDPYRSLAGLVRRAGGYEKSSRPFAEFIWANHLRTRVAIPDAANASLPFVSLVAATGGGEGGGVVDVSTLVPLALEHAAHRDAEGLPGFAGSGGEQGGAAVVAAAAAAAATTAAAPGR
jgi:hypothetical protein